jgi:hypothetical protein
MRECSDLAYQRGRYIPSSENEVLTLLQAVGDKSGEAAEDSACHRAGDLRWSNVEHAIPSCLKK